ncbi:chymotrypsin-like protease CTRL-1 isoform X1 [Apis dorsata]|uniref:chymotrypsin-like protease CTRL-1 isoform X1 n=1 Tax=Apis dorsata TaxID=7462 RepID=UPI0003DF60D5|nr:chymotrypsin-like protease CTRL-1 isoform X1 [Apis dorsata]XP_031367485.1 chymotrypsin-like protease CTRL-1 isoform X1 [Apis dorsata]
MILTSINSFLFVLVALNTNVLCAPAWNALPKINEWNSPNNHTSYDQIDELDEDRIFGGEYAMQNQFPFMAVVHQLKGNGRISQCGGTIISSRWVLTAGHCVASGPHQFLVVFGTRDKTGIAYNFYQGPGVAMLTTQAVLHPEYRTTMNDIALLYMPQNIPFGNNIRPIQFVGNRYNTYADKTGMVIGWGKDGPTGTGTKRLKYAAVPIISNYECSMYWPVTEAHVCTSAAYDEDACQGDSGGPLIVMKNRKPFQIGIVSYGDGNCPSSKPGVFTRVSSFVDWIEEVTNIHL